MQTADLPMNSPIVLTVIAKDEPGVIRTVSAVLKSHGGNWTESSMSSLAGQFAGILQAWLPERHLEACISDFDDLQGQGIQIIARRGGAEEAEHAQQHYGLDLVGNDREGIVSDITQILARHDVNVHSLETSVEPASMSGGMLFRARAEVSVSANTETAALEADLEDLANDLMVDLKFEQ